MSTLAPELTRGTIIRSRVRLARNIQGYPFKVTDPKVANLIVQKVSRALVKCGTFSLFNMSSVDSITLEAMKERHLISSNLIENKKFGAAFVNSDESVSVMVHEEDVIREQCFSRGLNLDLAYKVLDKIDDELDKNLNIAFSKDLGYLTACPTNLGTGLRASVMLFLPALTECGKISELIEEVGKLGLTVRGLYGEGSSADGYIYQISNEITLGYSEFEIIRVVEETVERICQAERTYREKLYCGKNQLKTIDRAKKSFAILTNAVLLSYGEFLEHIAYVKLGSMLGLLNINDIEKIDDLIIEVRPASLMQRYGKKLSALDRDLFRAEFVGQKLTKLKDD